MSEAKSIISERRGEIAWLIINRADKANALTTAMMEVLAAELTAAAADASVKALVLTGAGRRAFSGGVDFRSASELSADQARALRSQRFFELLLVTARCEKPLIAGLNGVASGGGVMLALLADRVVASEQAALSLPEIDLGGPTYPGLAILAHIGGAGIASDLVQTGRRMPAAEALARGLIAEVVAADALEGRIDQAAVLLGSKPAQAFALNKAWLRRPLITALREADAGHRALRAAKSGTDHVFRA